MIRKQRLKTGCIPSSFATISNASYLEFSEENKQGEYLKNIVMKSGNVLDENNEVRFEELISIKQ